MSRGLRRRIERMGQYQARQPGRMIVVTVADSRRHEAGLVDATLVSAGLVATDQDLVVAVVRYGADGAEPPCAVVSMTPMQPARRAVRP